MLSRMPIHRFWNWLAFYELEYGPKQLPQRKLGKLRQTWQEQMDIMSKFFRGKP